MRSDQPIADIKNNVIEILDVAITFPVPTDPSGVPTARRLVVRSATQRSRTLRLSDRMFLFETLKEGSSASFSNFLLYFRH
jgi:hypothetical protein